MWYKRLPCKWFLLYSVCSFRCILQTAWGTPFPTKILLDLPVWVRAAVLVVPDRSLDATDVHQQWLLQRVLGGVRAFGVLHVLDKSLGRNRLPCEFYHCLLNGYPKYAKRDRVVHQSSTQ